MTPHELKWCVDLLTAGLDEALTPKKIANLLINCSKKWRDELVAWSNANPEPVDIPGMVRFAVFKLKEKA